MNVPNLRFRSIPLLGLIGLLLMLSVQVAQAAGVQATVSRNPVQLNESFQLSFESAQELGQPDLSPLREDLEILGSSQSTNISRVNGRMERKVSIDLQVMAKRAGAIRIPPVSFGAVQSNPLDLKVLEAPPPDQGGGEDRGDLFLEVALTPERVYVQQQAVLSIRIYRAQDLGEATLTPPRASDPNAVVKRLGEDQDFTKMQGGRRYRVTERRYLVFPQASGKLEFEPFVFQGELMGANSRSSSVFPFGGIMRRGEVKRLRSEALALEVRPAPDSWGREAWLPSENLQLVEAWPSGQPEFRVGEPVTRTLMLLADGLTSAQLPAIRSDLPQGLKQYPDQPELKDRENADGVTGIRQERIAMVPAKAGEFELPAVEVRWWNTETDQPEVARVAAQTIRVLPALNQPAPVAPPSLEDAPGGDRTAPPKAAEAGLAKTVTDPGLWPWLALGLGAGWLITLLAWWRSVRANGGAAKPQAAPKPAAVGRLKAELKAAALSNDPKATAEALLSWAEALWPEGPPRSLGAVAGRTEDKPAATEIRALERILYASQGQRDAWQGQGFWAAVKGLEAEDGAKKTDLNRLQPLYPGSAAG